MAKDTNATDHLIQTILNKHRAKNAQQGKQQGRASPAASKRPYDRPAPSGPRNNESSSDNVWKHDKYEGSRLSDRLQGGQELLPSNRSQGMRGFTETGKQQQQQQQRKGPVELLGGGQTVSSAGPVRPRAGGNRLFQNAMGTAPTRPAGSVPRRNVNDAPVELLASEPKPSSAARAAPPVVASRTPVQEQAPTNASFGIKGAANPQMKVLIEGLVQGTTAVDVEFAFKQHVDIIAAALAPSTSSTTVSAELTVENREVAQQMVQKFNGIIADGNPLKVSIVEPPPVLSLKDRMRSKPGNAMDVDDVPAKADLLASGPASKMYSDEILQSDPRASIITVEARQNQGRGNGRNARGNGRARGSLASRLAA
ncbi:hypothetical protein NliqN6_4295 [Naganishia liquefaciens]|uniref:RRM domain-containing protein n=1 Tax=Naganishia liquefaciens TaxID=104408 RepID=A0A8H3YG36_9TREE|nr:hypothetical protein NliqN6_4295 [Naganishia liquefaciens]